MELDKWVLKNSQRIKIKNFLWPKKWNIDISDIEVTLDFTYGTSVGRGSCSDQNLALRKAISEAIERAFMIEQSFETSNGMAAHTNQDAAITKARNELIERDSFLCHFYKKIPFKPLTGIKNFFSPISEKLLHLGIKIEFFELIYPNGVLCVAFGKNYSRPFGTIMGSAIENSFDTAMKSAGLECLRQCICFIENDSFTSLDLNSFMQKRRFSFDDHFRLGLDLDYFDQIKFLYNSSNSSSLEMYIPTDIQCIQLSSEIPLFKECPLSVVKGKTEGLQQMFLGPVTREKINFDRINRFAYPSKLEFEDLLNLPHPYN